MGFLNPLKAIGKGLSKLPGAKTLNKPINKALGKTPGLKSVPGKLGMAEKKPSPIAPTPAAGAGMVQDKVQASAASPGGQMSPPPPPPMMQPQMQAPMQMQEAPEEVMGMQEQMMSPPPQMQAPPQMMPPGATPQFDPSSLMQKLRQGNTGVTGGAIGRRPSGIGPRFMG